MTQLILDLIGEARSLDGRKGYATVTLAHDTADSIEHRRLIIHDEAIADAVICVK